MGSFKIKVNIVNEKSNATGIVDPGRTQVGMRMIFRRNYGMSYAEAVGENFALAFSNKGEVRLEDNESFSKDGVVIIGGPSPNDISLRQGGQPRVLDLGLQSSGPNHECYTHGRVGQLIKEIGLVTSPMIGNLSPHNHNWKGKKAMRSSGDSLIAVPYLTRKINIEVASDSMVDSNIQNMNCLILQKSSTVTIAET
ncbi:hypothetical protein Ancab_018565 [Ancistrocladus abbreviatus]